MGAAESIPVELRHRVFNLVSQARNNIGTLRSDALREIWLLTENDDYKIPLCDSSLQFLPLIRDILTTSLNDQVSLKNTIACICNLSTHQQNKIIICSPTLGILSSLVNLMDETHGVLVQDANAKKWLYTTLSNCALNPITHPYLLADGSVRYLEVLKNEMERDPTYLPPIKSFGCISLSLPNQYAHLVINLRVHEIIVNRLMSFGPVPSAWPDRNTGMAYWSLNFITAFSGLPDGRKALRALNKVDFFLQLLVCTEMEGIKASIITSNIFVQDDVYSTFSEKKASSSSSSSPNGHVPVVAAVPSTAPVVVSSLPTVTSATPTTTTASVLASKSLLESYPQLFPTLMDVYSATLDFDANRSEVKSLLSRGFGYAIVKMRDLSATLRNLSISSDKNKEIMLNHPSLLPFVLKSVYLFIDNKPELNAIYHNYREYAGGGGKDLETIEYLLELLLQLSFFYYDNKELMKHFLKPEYNMIAMLQAFLSLPLERSGPYEAKQYATLLLNRLLPLQPLSIIPQHIVFSYAKLNNSFNQPYHLFLGSLSKRMKEMGYDIWKDDEGSYLVSTTTAMSRSGGFSGGYDDYMDVVAETVQNAYMVVIFLTPEYADDYHCKIAAKYAKMRSQSHDLKITYVMLNKDYQFAFPNSSCAAHTSTTTAGAPNTTSSNTTANTVSNTNTNSTTTANNTNSNNTSSAGHKNSQNNASNNNHNHGDGWLGLMIGDEQWYPLWESSHIDATANSLAAIAGNNAKLDHNKKILAMRKPIFLAKAVQTDPMMMVRII
jgi:hypothetical protein